MIIPNFPEFYVEEFYVPSFKILFPGVSTKKVIYLQKKLKCVSHK